MVKRDSIFGKEVLHGATVATPDRIHRRHPAVHNGLPSHGEVIDFMSSVRRDRVLFIGAGYVGGPSAAMMAYKCHDIEVRVVDISESRISQWNSPNLPIYEAHLENVVLACRGRNLFFSTDVAAGIRDCDVIFLAVNTPTKRFGVGKGKAADLTVWENAGRYISSHSTSSKIIIEKSTVPVRTAESLDRLLKANSMSPKIKFSILSNPEFLAEGTAMRDLEIPDRVLIGADPSSPLSSFSSSVLRDIYKRWVPEEKILTINLWSSELAKLVSNAFLAQRVASLNTVGMLCEKTDADVREVARALGADSRIGPDYLNASVGFGGSCLQKDLLSLAYICDFYGLKEVSQYWTMVKEMNDLQKCRFTQRIIHGLFDSVDGKRIAVFGFTFKKDTADVRDTPALDVCAALLGEGASVRVFDPRAPEGSAREEFSRHNVSTKHPVHHQELLTFEESPMQAVQGAHAIVVLTEWVEFKQYCYEDFFASMTKPAFIFDGRNILDHTRLASIGFEVHGVGVPSLHGSWSGPSLKSP